MPPRRLFCLHAALALPAMLLLCAGAWAAQAFAIPAGPLAQVMAQYAHAAGVALSFDAAPLAGLRSPGLQGRYGVDAGFAKVLEGSGLQAVRGAGGAYTLRTVPQAVPASGPQDAATLATVTVRAEAGAAATEHSQSYAGGAVTLFKGAQPARGIPQPVTVVTRQLMDDRAQPDLHDVLQNTPGIAVDYTDSERVTYWSRGHQIDALQVDGLALSHGTSAALFVQPDTAVLDRVEMLRGAAGLLRGAGNPSATVNLVRKRPTAQFQASAGLTLGAWNRRRLEADIAGSLGAAGALRGRLVAVADEKDFFQQARAEKREVLYGAIEADLGPRTTFTASLQHTGLDATGAWGGLPAGTDGAPLHLPRSTYLGTDWNRWNRHNQQAFAELEQRLDGGWAVRLSAARTRLRSDAFKQTSFSSASATDPYLVNVNTAIYGAGASDQDTADLAASGPFELFGRRHTLTVGADTLRVKTTGISGHWNVSPLYGVDLRTWNPYTSYPEPFYTEGNGTAYTADSSRTHQHGLYATARLSLAGPLTAIMGGRASWWRHQVPASPERGYGVGREVTPYAGLVYDLSDAWSAYASYSEIFAPQNYKDAGGRVLDPVRGEDFEAGLKGELPGGRLNATLAVFRIRNVGAAVVDTRPTPACMPHESTISCYRAGGSTRSEGWELEVAGEPRPGWQLMAGYTYTRYRDGTAATAAALPVRSGTDPRHAARLFARWRPGGPLQGWTLGGGARIQSGTRAELGGVTARQGGYALFDAMVGYRIDETYTVQLNVNNLFDKVYYAKFAPNSTYFNNYYGEPRNVMLSLRARF